MQKFLKFIVTFLLIAMTAAAIFSLIAEPKSPGSYAALITVIFFNVVGYLALYNKNNKIYIALHDPSLGEENDGENN